MGRGGEVYTVNILPLISFHTHTQEQVDEAVKAARKPLLEAARDRAISDMCEKARQVALQAGADPETLQIVEQEEVGLSYLPGSATRIKVSIRPKSRSVPAPGSGSVSVAARSKLSPSSRSCRS